MTATTHLNKHDEIAIAGTTSSRTPTHPANPSHTYLTTTETTLFNAWLALPHPSLNIPSLLFSYAKTLPKLSKAENADMKAKVGEEMEDRFASYAVKLDKWHASIHAHSSDGRYKARVD